MGVGQHLGVGRALIGHPAEDVVGGAVDDPAHPLDPVAPQGLLQGFDDRDPTAHGGFDQHVDAFLGGGGRNFFAVARDHSLVGGDDGLSSRNCRQDQTAGGLQATHDLNDDVDRGVLDDRFGVGAEDLAGELDGPRAVQIPDGHAFERQISHERVATVRGLQDFRNACSHSAEPEQADADGHPVADPKGVILEIDLPGLRRGGQGAGLGLHHLEDVQEAVGP